MQDEVPDWGGVGTDRSKPSQESAVRRNFPDEFEMGNHIDVDDVDGAFASYLVRDVDVTTSRIARFLRHSHSVALHLLPCERRFRLAWRFRFARRYRW